MNLEPAVTWEWRQSGVVERRGKLSLSSPQVVNHPVDPQLAHGQPPGLLDS
jgi:hypothetical protein